nr:beta-hexosaminidase [Sphingomonas sp.]
GMTSHLVYSRWDAERPASQSPTIIHDIIRGRIGFDGWLISDDIGMDALRGGSDARAAGVVAAGCDVALHCTGDMAEMVAVAGAVAPMTAESEERLARAMATALVDEEGPDYAEAAAKRDELLALA